MANQPNDHLFLLIKSLTKAEKRGFKIYATRNSAGDAKFIQLFDALDKAKEFDEDSLIRRLPDVNRNQLSNLKAHLYRQILTSLRLNYVNHNVDIQIREQIDYARILYDKGLYIQSLKVLEKAKSVSMQNSRISLSSEILGFEKLIESQYITRSLRNRADQLIEESTEAMQAVQSYHKLSNLALRLYGIYIKAGHVRNERDYQVTQAFFRRSLDEIRLDNPGFIEKHYLHVSHAWYSLIVQDFLLLYRHAHRWVDHFRNHPSMLALEPIWYLKGMHVLLEALFMLGHDERHLQETRRLEEFMADPPARVTDNFETLGFQYLYTARINSHFMTGTFTEGLGLIPELLEKIERLSDRIDPHRVLVFYYKVACLHFCAGNLQASIDYLNRIINYPDSRLREDIHCFARILSLIAHYDLGNESLLEHQVRSTYRFIRKMNDLNPVQEEVLKFLRNLPAVRPGDLHARFRALRDRLLELREMPYQSRAFLYLDIISWLESKIEQKPIEEVIRAKSVSRHRI